MLVCCPTLCDPIDGSPPGSSVSGILQARTLEWVAISFSMHESEKWKRSRSVVFKSLWPHGLQPTRLLHPWDFPGKSTGVGCHCLLLVASKPSHTSCLKSLEGKKKYCDDPCVLLQTGWITSQRVRHRNLFFQQTAWVNSMQVSALQVSAGGGSQL